MKLVFAATCSFALLTASFAANSQDAVPEEQAVAPAAAGQAWVPLLLLAVIAIVATSGGDGTDAPIGYLGP
jgi:hypothetical protein